ncbi:MAG: hypothetical protein JWR38_2899 [Mucilaginibacter sp.]|nr:hypothetical protein [Mucilaginibacter sp.]
MKTIKNCISLLLILLTFHDSVWSANFKAGKNLVADSIYSLESVKQKEALDAMLQHWSLESLLLSVN